MRLSKAPFRAVEVGAPSENPQSCMEESTKDTCLEGCPRAVRTLGELSGCLGLQLNYCPLWVMLYTITSTT